MSNEMNNQNTSVNSVKNDTFETRINNIEQELKRLVYIEGFPYISIGIDYVKDALESGINVFENENGIYRFFMYSQYHVMSEPNKQYIQDFIKKVNGDNGSYIDKCGKFDSERSLQELKVVWGKLQEKIKSRKNWQEMSKDSLVNLFYRELDFVVKRIGIDKVNKGILTFMYNLRYNSECVDFSSYRACLFAYLCEDSSVSAGNMSNLVQQFEYENFFDTINIEQHLTIVERILSHDKEYGIFLIKQAFSLLREKEGLNDRFYY